MSRNVHFHAKMNRMNFVKFFFFLKTNQYNVKWEVRLNCLLLRLFLNEKLENKLHDMFKRISTVYHTQSISISPAAFQLRNVCPANMKRYCTSNEIRKTQPETSTKVLSRLNVIKSLDFKEYKERSTLILQNKWTNVYTFYERVFHMVLNT